MKTQTAHLKSTRSRIGSTSAGLLILLSTHRAAVIALFFAGATVFSTWAASAVTITVINTNDSGPGSLRQALVDANDGDMIDFDSSLKGQTITLTSGQLNVNKNVTISGPGPGADQLTVNVDLSFASRVFYISVATVAISNLTITGGAAESGGGIFNYVAALTVSNCIISGNYGSGIYNSGGTLTVSDCIISGNNGSGIDNVNTTLMVNSCTISSNSRSGISSWAQNGAATLTINNSTLTGNWADAGGGIHNIAFNGYATLTVSNCTISGNTAGYGGGISNGAGGGKGASSIVIISNSTLSSNSAAVDGGAIYHGGYRSLVSLSVKNSTISGNSAVQGGGGIYNFGAAQIENTVLNSGSFGENIFNTGFGTVTSLGYNVSSDDGGGFLAGPGDQINTDSMLGPLQDNGGPTFTHALLPGSPAINAGDPGFTPPPDYDQRGPGFDRVVNGRIDVGSFEVQAGPTPTPTPTPSPTATATPSASPSPRPSATARPRPTPAPRA